VPASGALPNHPSPPPHVTLPATLPARAHLHAHLHTLTLHALHTQVMEALEGGTLRQLVLQQMTSHAPVYTPRDALRWAVAMCACVGLGTTWVGGGWRRGGAGVPACAPLCVCLCAGHVLAAAASERLKYLSPDSP
jgi:hypothetical protein